MGSYMEIFEVRVLGENLYLHQKFTQCSKWSTSPLLQIFPCKNPSKIMIITSHMQKNIQIYPCLLKLSHKTRHNCQNWWFFNQKLRLDLNNVLHVACNYHYFGWVFTWKYLKQGFWGEIFIYIRGVNKTQFSKLVIFQPKTKILPQNPFFKYFHVRTHPR
jgi:hypothetical protein